MPRLSHQGDGQENVRVIGWENVQESGSGSEETRSCGGKTHCQNDNQKSREEFLFKVRKGHLILCMGGCGVNLWAPDGST